MNDALLHNTLKDRFGYDSFRHHQKAVIDRTLQGQDSLVIMPTGGGKSICYQLPATLLPGLTLVVSPLISLMQDQVASLNTNGIQAATLNSHLDMQERQQLRKGVANRTIKLLYVSPEKAVSPTFIGWINQHPISQIAIDEAHCVSMWGHGFRPEYQRLVELTTHFPNTPVVALTATADPATQKDIINQLQLEKPRCFVSSFERKNIHIDVLPAKDRHQTILRFIQAHPDQAGIIYSLSRKSTEENASKLQRAGVRAAFYHGQLDAQERERVQTQFQRDEIQVICATVAFGMGIDKPNTRWVIHYSLPKNLESYYQEIGRAGRDGEPADALLFAGGNDIRIYKQMIAESDDPPEYKAILEAKLHRMWEFTRTTSCRTNLVLNYFGEFKAKPCGHCDRCLNAPEKFDGTVLAQKALSACYHLAKMGRAVGAPMLVNILRGSLNYEIRDHGYHLIKTHGLGQDIDWKTWIGYLTQLVDQGLLAIDYAQHSTLHLTELAKPVLLGKQPVELYDENKITYEKKTESSKQDDTSDTPVDLTLFEALRTLRTEIAQQENTQPFIIFSNKTLEDIARKKPSTSDALLQCHGIGKHKLAEYGERVLRVVNAADPLMSRQTG